MNERIEIDTAYIDLLNDLAFEYIKSDPTQSLPYINKAIKLADSIQYLPGLIRAITNKGNGFWVIGLPDQALGYYLLALLHGTERFPLEHARINNNIGEVFKKKKMYDSAMKYYREALRTVELKLNKKPSIIAYNIAEVFFLQNQIDSAELYFTTGKQYSEEFNDKRGMAYSYFGLAEISFSRGLFREALTLQNKSLDLRIEIEDNRGIIQNQMKLAEYYLENGFNNQSYKNITEAKALSREIKANDLLLEVSYLEYSFLTLTRKYREAAEVLAKYELLKDSLRTAEFSTTVKKIKSSLTAEIKSRENQLLIQQRVNGDRINRSRLFVVVAFSVIIIISILFIYQFREKKRLLKHQKEKDILIEKLRLRNKNHQEFNSVISHNLREPLTQIIGYAKFYENGNTGLNTEDLIGHIKNSSFKIDQTIRDLSVLLNEKEPDVEDFRDFNLKRTIVEILESFREKTELIESEILIDIEEDLTIKSYKPFIHDIFYHLISNSIRFRNEERILEITINTESLGNKLRISISDNGLGLDEEKVRNKIFKMYQKFHPEIAGRGIGLYIVKSRVAALLGDVSVKSEKNVGSTFQVLLPIN